MMRNRDNRSGGFTLLETLATVAILVILLAVSAVGVARYRDHLKITELDNAAREIYMAAENRAVLLQNSGATVKLLTGKDDDGYPLLPQLPLSLAEGGKSINARVLSSANLNAKLDDLVPQGSIDPALRDGDGQFVVVYDEETGHVVEAFYAEGSFGTRGGDLAQFRKSRSERVSEFRGGTTNRLVGHYGSSEADNIGTKPLPTPGVEVIIENGDELKLIVRVTMPAEGLLSGVTVGRAFSVEMEYDGTSVPLPVTTAGTGRLPTVEPLGKNVETLAPGETVSYTWVLDSLNPSMQFKNLVSGELGKDFTVTASLKLTADGYIDSAYYAQGTDNSLFAKGSTYNTADGTALIANLRHLQNLCGSEGTGFTSKVGDGIKQARQLVDINCEKYLGTDYPFVPIVNDNLTSYNGRYGDKNTHIFNLSTAETADAGLFGTVSRDLNIEDCRGCWKGPETLAGDGDYVYAVSGTGSAGGLIGRVSGGTVTVNNSFAATTVSGANTGGLVGKVEAGGKLTVTNSYADCYLKGSAKAGGLVGSGTVAKLESCYAAGFITGGTDTAGLVNGNVTSVSNTYSVVRILKDGLVGKPSTPLYGSNVGDGSGSVFYLYKAASATENVFGPAFEYIDGSASPVTYPYDLRYKVSNNAADKCTPPYPFPGLNSLPHYGDWAELDGMMAAGLVYYEEYTGGAYGLLGWYENTKLSTLKQDTANPVVTKDGYALVFDVTRFGVPAGSYKATYGPTKTYTLTKNPDGTKNDDGNDMTWCWNGYSYTSEVFTVTEGSATYTVVPLPNSIVGGVLVDGDKFFQHLKVEPVKDELNESDTRYDREFYFNPHFAGTEQVTVQAGKVKLNKLANGEVEVNGYEELPKPPAEPIDMTKKTGKPEDNAILVRTPRHFYDLSRSYESRNTYYVYYFKQALDIDYEKYTGMLDSGGNRVDVSKLPFLQSPIGVSEVGLTANEEGYKNEFKGGYDGGCHIIRNVFFRSEQEKPKGDKVGYYLGLFGITDDTAKNVLLKNIIYELDPTKTMVITGRDEGFRSVGALVGKNYGTMENCAVYGVNMTVKGKYIGGLAGYNQNTIKNCSAEVAYLTAILHNNETDEVPFAGGLVGKQLGGTGTIENSYAVGRLERSADSTKSSNQKPGTQAIAGLVGGSEGKVINCYAAVDLVKKTNSVDFEIYGLCNPAMIVAGDQSGWLNDVFAYRGVKYNTVALDDYADKNLGKSFTELETAVKSPLTTASTTVRNIPDGAKGDLYRATYEGKNFPYFTGVTTTIERNLATGKITKKLTTGKPIHYGLWPAPLTAGLVYYEAYGTKGLTDVNAYSYGIAGTYEGVELYSLKTNDELKSGNLPVAKDGYALVFEADAENPVPAGEYKIRYGNSGQNTYTLEKLADGGMWKWKNENKPPRYPIIVEQGGRTYTVFPLPEEAVTGALPGGDKAGAKFYQKLVYTPNMLGERTFYFNPHFAKTVKGGTVSAAGVYAAPAQPAEPRNNVSGLAIKENDKVKAAWEKNAISVRTARHFYALSIFQHSYVDEVYKATTADDNRIDEDQSKRYYYRQELDIDYGTYGWYGNNKPTPQNGVVYQDPIGIAWRDRAQESVQKESAGGDKWNQDDGFKGAYDGGGHTIENVFYKTDYLYNSASQYLGLFRYAEYLWNVNYKIPNVGTATLPKYDGHTSEGIGGFISDGPKVGTLAGGAFRVLNCTATLSDLTINGYGNEGHIYVGGLIGYSNKAENCHTEITGCLRVGGNVDYIYAGGLQGILYNDIVNCTSKVNSLVVDSAAKNCYAGGLVGGVNADSRVTAHVIANCAAEIKSMTVKANTEAYGAGLVGSNLRGGAILSSYAVGAIGAGNNDMKAHYSGLVGRTGATTINKVTYTPKAVNCYAAVGVPTTNGYDFCSNDVGTFTNCVYLSGSWTYNGVSCTARKKNTITNVTGETIDKLKAHSFGEVQHSFTVWGTTTVYTMPTMGKVPGTNAYPFPTDVKRDGQWYYPGSDWPKKVTAAASLLSDDMEPAPGEMDLDAAALPGDTAPAAADPEPLPGEPEYVPGDEDAPVPDAEPAPEDAEPAPAPESGLEEAEPGPVADGELPAEGERQPLGALVRRARAQAGERQGLLAWCAPAGLFLGLGLLLSLGRKRKG